MLAYDSTRVTSFLWHVFEQPPKWCTYSADMAGATWNYCIWCVLCTPYNHAPCHFMQSHIHKKHVCLAVTCYLYFWQKDQELSHATAVTRGWNRYQNKSQHRKFTLEKKILLLLLPGLEPVTFQSRVQYSNHWAIPTPQQSLLNQGFWLENGLNKVSTAKCTIFKI